MIVDLLHNETTVVLSEKRETFYYKVLTSALMLYNRTFYLFQEFVQHVLPYGVLDVERIAAVAGKIRHSEQPETFLESPSSADDSTSNAATLATSPPIEPRLGLNQARDLFFESGDDGHGGVSLASCSLRNGTVHSCDEESAEGRFGPGYYQCTRFSPAHELAVLGDWPATYRLKFKADKDVYLLGACVTETDSMFYKPSFKGVLRLKDPGSSSVLAEGSETWTKKCMPWAEGGLPQPLDYGPHDVSFKAVAHIYKGKWYELTLDLTRLESVMMSGSASVVAASRKDEVTNSTKMRMLVPRCKNKATFFGVNFDFEECDPEFCASAAASLWDVEEEDEEDSEQEAIEGGGQKPKPVKSLAYGLISRLYFYY